MPFQRDETLAAGIVGQGRGKGGFEVSKATLEETQITEQAHLVFQALNRLACRQTVDGKAVGVEFYLFNQNAQAILEVLRTVMPNFQEIRYQPVLSKDNTDRVGAEGADHYARGGLCVEDDTGQRTAATPMGKPDHACSKQAPSGRSPSGY